MPLLKGPRDEVVKEEEVPERNAEHGCPCLRGAWEAAVEMKPSVQD